MSQSRRLYSSLGVGELLTEKAAVLLLLGAVGATAAILYGNAAPRTATSKRGPNTPKRRRRARQPKKKRNTLRKKKRTREAGRSRSRRASSSRRRAPDSCRSACSSPAAALAPWTSLRFRARDRSAGGRPAGALEGTASSACFVPRWHLHGRSGDPLRRHPRPLGRVLGPRALLHHRRHRPDSLGRVGGGRTLTPALPCGCRGQRGHRRFVGRHPDYAFPPGRVRASARRSSSPTPWRRCSKSCSSSARSSSRGQPRSSAPLAGGRPGRNRARGANPRGLDCSFAHGPRGAVASGAVLKPRLHTTGECRCAVGSWRPVGAARLPASDRALDAPNRTLEEAETARRRPDRGRTRRTAVRARRSSGSGKRFLRRAARRRSGSPPRRHCGRNESSPRACRRRSRPSIRRSPTPHSVSRARLPPFGAAPSRGCGVSCSGSAGETSSRRPSAGGPRRPSRHSHQPWRSPHEVGDASRLPHRPRRLCLAHLPLPRPGGRVPVRRRPPRTSRPTRRLRHARRRAPPPRRRLQLRDLSPPLRDRRPRAVGPRSHRPRSRACRRALRRARIGRPRRPYPRAVHDGRRPATPGAHGPLFDGLYEFFRRSQLPQESDR